MFVRCPLHFQHILCCAFQTTWLSLSSPEMLHGGGVVSGYLVARLQPQSAVQDLEWAACTRSCLFLRFACSSWSAACRPGISETPHHRLMEEVGKVGKVAVDSFRVNVEGGECHHLIHPETLSCSETKKTLKPALLVEGIGDQTSSGSLCLAGAVPGMALILSLHLNISKTATFCGSKH